MRGGDGESASHPDLLAWTEKTVRNLLAGPFQSHAHHRSACRERSGGPRLSGENAESSTYRGPGDLGTAFNELPDCVRFLALSHSLGTISRAGDALAGGLGHPRAVPA